MPSSIDIFTNQIKLNTNFNAQTIQKNNILKIGIFIHIYKIENFNFILTKIQALIFSLKKINIKFQLDFFISTGNDNSKFYIKNKLSYYKFSDKIVIISGVENDIEGFLVIFNNEIKNYDIGLKLYDEKTKLTNNEELHKIIDSIVDPETINAIINNFLNNEKLGIILPSITQIELSYLSNDIYLNTILSSICKQSIQQGWNDYSIESIFWFRPESINLLLSNENISFIKNKEINYITAIRQSFIPACVILQYKWARIEKKYLNTNKTQIKQITNLSLENFYIFLKDSEKRYQVDPTYYQHKYGKFIPKNMSEDIHFQTIGKFKGYLPNKNIFNDIDLLKNSNYFDSLWYYLNYPDVSKLGLSPEYHYLLFGWKKGFNPSIQFNGNNYLIAYPDVAVHSYAPLIHYELYGKNEGRKIFPVLNTENLNLIDIFTSNSLNITNKSISVSFNHNKKTYKRIAIFAFFNKDLIIYDYVVHYLQELNKICDCIIFISDCYLPITEINKIAKFINFCKCQRHEEYDFGSYKQGFLYALKYFINEDTEEVIFCNDSCYGPITPLIDLFKKMSTKEYDFWGITSNYQYSWHIQSYFLVLKKNVFLSSIFYDFITSIYKQKNVTSVILNYEIGLSHLLIESGFHPGCLINGNFDNFNITAFPLTCLKNGSPFIKIKSLTIDIQNMDGVYNTIKYIKHTNFDVYKYILNHNKQINYNEEKDEDENISFSIILPTYNRKSQIDNAIKSVINQIYQNYELIIIDDGSTDNTVEYIKEKYSVQIQNKKIIIVSLNRNYGASYARNKGLEIAKNDWIAYLDSDNTIHTNFLLIFADKIKLYHEYKTFYCQYIYKNGNIKIGKNFSYKELLKNNYIDLGTFVHHKSLIKLFGGFNNKINRLLDWDLIIRYTKEYPPLFINIPLLFYNNENNIDRISNKSNFDINYKYIYTKYNNFPSVTTCIISYNQHKYIAQAIESVLMQQGDFKHRILIADDGSTDGTREIIDTYSNMYPMYIKNISTKNNKGVSENYRYAFKEVNSDYIAICEGDDYWTDENKISNQINFLQKYQDCSMVFSRICVSNLYSLKSRLLNRQNNLPSKLTVEDILKDKSLNLIANFSCCMFRSKLIHELPNFIFYYRLSEIPIYFWMNRFGYIGYINKTSSIYRQHENGIWSGLNKKEQLYNAFIIRMISLIACQDKYRPMLKKFLENNFYPSLELENISLTNWKTKFLKDIYNNTCYNYYENFL